MICAIKQINILKSFVIAVFLLGLVNQPVLLAKKLPDIESDMPQLQSFEEANINDSDIKVNNEFPDLNWWEDFKDPVLSRYVLAALDNNHDLKSASLAIEESKALVRESLGNELPSITINPAYTRQKNSKNLTTPSIQQFEGAGPKLFSPGSTVNIFTAPLNTSYEADFWLKNRKTTLAKKKHLESVQQTYKTAMVLISTEVANAYFNLLKVDKLIELQNKEIKLYKDTYDLLKAQFDAGLISYIEVINAEENLKRSMSQMSEYELSRSLFVHQLLVLMGQSTANSNIIDRASIDSIILPEKLKTGVPSDLVSRRPDILSAEATLARSKIEVSLARKAFFPSIVLSGSYGYASTKLSQIFNWDSVLTSFTSSVAQSIFTGGSRRAALRAKKFKYEQYLHDYYQTVLNAFQEVEDSIASYKYHYKENSNNLERLDNMKDSVLLMDSKYDQGLVSYVDVINPNISLLQVEKEQLISKSSCLIDMLSVYKALGGGY
ncbi:MAG: efflux transporter outer membrane subunit [Cyanobacteriota bacterium]